MDALKDIIRTCPIIDNHAHNLLRYDKLETYSLLTATTEAQGKALLDTPRSLSHLRAVKQLRELYGCPKDTTWDDLMEKRRELLEADPDLLTTRCLEGIHAILIDDGINDEDTVYPYDWHDQFVSTPTRRIVRIETVAASIMKAMCEEGQIPSAPYIANFDHGPAWVLFLQTFETAIADEIKSGNVAGFKSVCCYRTGLDVKVDSEINVATAGQDAFLQYIRDSTHGNYRIGIKGLNDCLVISTCRLLAAGNELAGISKPLQFHTGLGDNDISLLRSNPAYLQPLISEFPTVKMILLHSAYPYTRKAGYLATVYPNVYLDLGEVFPMVSRDGQVGIIRQSLELTPFTKLLWSTDGHHFPETYWLANKQFREVLERVLVGYVDEGDLTTEQAIETAKDIMFNNSNRVYHLNLQFPTRKAYPEVGHISLCLPKPRNRAYEPRKLRISPYYNIE